jgi:hypothetical protein
MPQNQTIAPKTPEGEDQSKSPTKLVPEELEKIADKAAKKAEREEQAYDADHDIFTK